MSWSVVGRPPTTALVVLVIVVAACTGSGPDESADSVASAADTASPTTDSTSVAEPEIDMTELPVREGARRKTTGDVPHIQLDAEPVPEIDAELRRRAYLLPGVEDRASLRSLPGARGLWLTGDLDLLRPEVLGGTRELAHIHPDGSLHIWLPVERAMEVDRTNWGEIHPWVDRDGFWDGVGMVFTPETEAELEVTLRLILDAYNYVTGAELDSEALE